MVVGRAGASPRGKKARSKGRKGMINSEPPAELPALSELSLVDQMTEGVSKMIEGLTGGTTGGKPAPLTRGEAASTLLSNVTTPFIPWLPPRGAPAANTEQRPPPLPGGGSPPLPGAPPTFPSQSPPGPRLSPPNSLVVEPVVSPRPPPLPGAPPTFPTPLPIQSSPGPRLLPSSSPIGEPILSPRPPPLPGSRPPPLPGPGAPPPIPRLPPGQSRPGQSPPAPRRSPPGSPTAEPVRVSARPPPLPGVSPLPIPPLPPRLPPPVQSPIEQSPVSQDPLPGAGRRGSTPTDQSSVGQSVARQSPSAARRGSNFGAAVPSLFTRRKCHLCNCSICNCSIR